MSHRNTSFRFTRKHWDKLLAAHNAEPDDQQLALREGIAQMRTRLAGHDDRMIAAHAPPGALAEIMRQAVNPAD